MLNTSLCPSSACDIDSVQFQVSASSLTPLCLPEVGRWDGRSGQLAGHLNVPSEELEAFRRKVKRALHGVHALASASLPPHPFSDDDDEKNTAYKPRVDSTLPS